MIKQEKLNHEATLPQGWLSLSQLGIMIEGEQKKLGMELPSSRTEVYLRRFVPGIKELSHPGEFFGNFPASGKWGKNRDYFHPILARFLVREYLAGKQGMSADVRVALISAVIAQISIPKEDPPLSTL